jgi:WD40 repeat protein
MDNRMSRPLLALAVLFAVGSSAVAENELKTLKGHSDTVNAVAFTPDGKRLATGSSDDLIIIWDAATGKDETTLKGHEDSVLGLCFSPDGKFLASAGADNSVRVWDWGAKKAIHVLKGHSDSCSVETFLTGSGQEHEVVGQHAE